MTDSIYDPFMHIPQSVFFILVMEHHWQHPKKDLVLLATSYWKTLKTTENLA
jgi:hypothetical protein